jgi:hypothetical protein
MPIRVCPSCQGTGLCSACDGTGRQPGSDALGCPVCRELGVCPTCNGQSYTSDDEALNVPGHEQVPARRGTGQSPVGTCWEKPYGLAESNRLAALARDAKAKTERRAEALRRLDLSFLAECKVAQGERSQFFRVGEAVFNEFQKPVDHGNP